MPKFLATQPERGHSVDSGGNHRVKVIIAFGLVYVFWGSTYLAIGMTSAEGIPPLVMCAIRFLIAGPLMLAGMCAFRQECPHLSP